MEIEEAVAAEEHLEMQAFPDEELTRSSFMSNTSTATCTIGYTRDTKVKLYGLIALTCVLLIASGGFTSIFIEDRNVNGAVSACFAAALSLGTLSLFLLHLFGKIETYHDQKTLGSLKILGMFISVASGIAVGVFTILAFLNHQSFHLAGQNYFSAAVFSGICLASSLQLYIVAQWYQNAMQPRGSLSSSSQLQSGIFP